MRWQFIIGLALVFLDVVFAIDAELFVGVHRNQHRPDVSLVKTSEIRQELRSYGDGQMRGSQRRAKARCKSAEGVRSQIRSQGSQITETSTGPV